MTFAPRLARAAFLLVLPTALAAGLHAAEDTLGPVEPPKSGFVFSLLPKAFQRNPDLEMTVNTELTDEGRLWRTPTAANPTYYISYATGYRQMGDTVGEHPPSSEVITRALRHGLAVNGFEPATREHPPRIIVFYFWGSHNRMPRDMEAQFPVLAARYRLERAMLVGGHAEMEKIADVMQFGESITDRTPQYEYLRDQVLDDLYFVVASAYDYQALARNQRKLLWRTTMTVNARGVSMKETLAPLIATAAPYFGRETSEPVIAQRRIGRWGVEVGEGKVIETDVPLPGPAKAAKPPAGAGAKAR